MKLGCAECQLFTIYLDKISCVYVFVKKTFIIKLCLFYILIKFGILMFDFLSINYFLWETDPTPFIIFGLGY